MLHNIITHDLGFVSAVLLFILWHSEDLTNNTDACYFLHTRRRCSSTTYTLDHVYPTGKEKVSRELVKERKRPKPSGWITSLFCVSSEKSLPENIKGPSDCPKTRVNVKRAHIREHC